MSTTADQKNKKVPDYMQQLFEHYCKSIKQFGNIIWINKEEFSKLNENIRKYLSDNNQTEDNKDNFIKWLQKTYKIKIKSPKTISYVVKNEDNDDVKTNYLDHFWDGKSVLLPSISY